MTSITSSTATSFAIQGTTTAQKASEVQIDPNTSVEAKSSSVSSSSASSSSTSSSSGSSTDVESVETTHNADGSTTTKTTYTDGTKKEKTSAPDPSKAKASYTQAHAGDDGKGSKTEANEEKNAVSLLNITV